MKQMCMCNVVSAAEKRCAACNHAVVCVTYTGVEGSLCLFRPTWLALAGVVDVLLLLCLLCPALNARLRRTNIDECRWACTGEVKRRRNLPRPLGGGQPHLCIMLPLDMRGDGAYQRLLTLLHVSLHKCTLLLEGKLERVLKTHKQTHVHRPSEAQGTRSLPSLLGEH